jgi:PleD family two-component response regulator
MAKASPRSDNFVKPLAHNQEPFRPQPIMSFDKGVSGMAVVLIVEDEEQVRVLAESVLQEHGHKILTAATVEQAIALLDGPEKIELLFTDVRLQDDLEGGLRLGQPSNDSPACRCFIRPGRASRTA